MVFNSIFKTSHRPKNQAQEWAWEKEKQMWSKNSLTKLQYSPWSPSCHLQPLEHILPPSILSAFHPPSTIPSIHLPSIHPSIHLCTIFQSTLHLARGNYRLPDNIWIDCRQWQPKTIWCRLAIFINSREVVVSNKCETLLAFWDVWLQNYSWFIPGKRKREKLVSCISSARTSARGSSNTKQHQLPLQVESFRLAVKK